jgi:hypothetical protein
MIFNLVQVGNAIVSFSRVGDGIQFPSSKDEAILKLDPYHHFFYQTQCSI